MYDLSMFRKFLWSVASADAHIIHKMCKVVWVFLFDCSEIPVCGSLEKRWCIAQSKQHDLWNVCANLCFERCFVPIFGFNNYIVIPSSNVKLCEDFFAFEFVQLSFCVCHGVMVFDSHVVYFAIINDHSKLPWLFLWDRECWRYDWGVPFFDIAHIQFFPNSFDQPV